MDLRKYRVKKKKQNKPAESAYIKNDRLFVYLFILLFVPLVLYSRVTGFEFSRFDDTEIIINHYDTISDLKNIKDTFTHDAFMNNDGALFYRPMQTISFMIDAQIGGKEPWIYHLTNLLLHLLTIIAFFFFLKKIGFRNEISFLLSLFFSIHPLFSNAVAWIPARGDLLLALFSLLSFITFLEYFKSNKVIYLLLHIVTFLLVLFSKETAVLLPLLILFYFYIVAKRNFTIKEIIQFLATWGLSFILFFYLRMDVVRVKLPPGRFGIIPIIKNMPVIPITFGKFFIPIKLSTLQLFDTTSIVIGIILLIGFTLLTYKFINGKKRFVLWGALWFLAFSIPPMLSRYYFSDFGHEYFDYRTYLPMMGILMIIGTLLDLLFNKYTFAQILKVFIPVSLIFTAIAYFHLNVYTDPVSFFSSAINANPQNALALNSRGCAYTDKGVQDMAIKDFMDAISVLPVYSTPLYNLGDTYKKSGDFTKAEYYYNKALKYDTLYNDINTLQEDAYINLSAMELILKKYDDALLILNKGKSVYPNNFNIFNNLGNLYFSTGKFDSAIIIFNKAIEINPNPASYTNRAIAKFRTNDVNGSLSDFNMAINLDPGFRIAYLNRGITRININDYEGAIADFTSLLKLDLRLAQAYYFRGMAYSKLNKQVESEMDLAEARKLGFQ